MLCTHWKLKKKIIPAWTNEKKKKKKENIDT